jgi:hypothetical protein
LPFLNALADCAATGRESFGQAKETVILRSNTHHKGRLDAHSPVDCGDSCATADRNDFRHRHQEILRQRENKQQRDSTAPQKPF